MSILTRLQVLISANTAELNKGFKESQKQLSGFANSLKGIAATVGVAFGAQQVANFTFEVIKLAGEAEGVRAAFERLPEAERIMSDLKTATAGTVSELDLMKRTVQAANFGIALESLPQLLEFAAIRAQQTGQSVDYLVDSIITGIGRKSPLILDNLGISAVRLKEQFGGAALEAQSIGDVAKAVGRIAGEELTKMGDFSENASTKIQRLGASWDNLKVSIGNLASGGVVNRALNSLTNFTNSLAGDELTTGIRELSANMLQGSEILERFAAAGGKIDLSWQEILARGFARTEEAAKNFEKALADIQKRSNDLAIAQKAIAETDPTTGMAAGGEIWKGRGEDANKLTVSLEYLKAKVSELNKQFETTDSVDKQKLANIGAEILGYQKQIEELEKLRKKQEEVNAAKLSGAGRQQAADAEARARGEAPGAEFTNLPFAEPGADDPRNLANVFPTEIPPPNIDAYLEALRVSTEATKAAGASAIESFDQMRLAQELQQEQYQRTANSALQFGEAVGDALGQAASGQITFAQALKRVTADLLKQFLSQALGAAIAGSLKTAKNPFIGIALAAAAVAAVGGLFKKATGFSGGSSGGASLSSGATNVSRANAAPGNQILFDGSVDFNIEGNKLVGVLNNQNMRSKVTG